MPPPRIIRKPIRRPTAALSQGLNDFEECWDLLRQAIVAIHKRESAPLKYEQLYRATYRVVSRLKQAANLYEQVRVFEEDWFREHILPSISDLVTTNLVNVALIQAPGTSLHERRHMAERFLRGIRDAWEHHTVDMGMICDVLMYLDRTYAAENAIPSVFSTTIGLFRDRILKSGLATLGRDQEQLHHEDFTVFDVLNAVVLDLINMERGGDVIDRNLIRSVVVMLENLYESDDEIPDQKLYLQVFEPRYLQASRTFYRQECDRLLRDFDTGYWLRYCRRRLDEERDRCSTTLSPLTTDKIAKVVESELIAAKLAEFLAKASGFRSMIDKDLVEDLSILYKLVRLVDDSMTPLKGLLQSRIMDLGMEIEKNLRNTDFSVPANGSAPDADEPGGAAADKAKAQPLNAAAQQTAAAIKWVDDVLALKDKFDSLWTTCFEKDLELQSVTAKSFAEFINMFDRSSEFVSLFIDDNLKRGSKGKTDSEVDIVLDKAIVLIRYLSDRDMFERYYQKHLARRLLHNKSDIDMEKFMVSRMKTEMGHSFTAKFEGMFKDIELSKDLAENYRDHISQLGDLDTKKIDLGIHVLTSNNWPPEVMGRSASQDDGSKGQCNYPPVIKRLQDSFYKFYLGDRSGRVLTWVGSAGTADIKCVFPKVPGKESGPLSRERRYELSVSTYGMIILLLFNDLADGESLTFEEIQAKTNIPPQELIRNLASLTIPPKSRVLTKEPVSKSVRASDKFSFNSQFASKAIKIKAPTITSVSKVEGDDERRETEQKNEQTRSHIVDAAIVRIMKARKQLRHTELTTEVIKQLASRFKPEISLIKKRIEDLLVREYLERVDGEIGVYRYLA